MGIASLIFSPQSSTPRPVLREYPAGMEELLTVCTPSTRRAPKSTTPSRTTHMSNASLAGTVRRGHHQAGAVLGLALRHTGCRFRHGLQELGYSKGSRHQGYVQLLTQVCD